MRQHKQWWQTYRNQPYVAQAIWAALALAFLGALITLRLSLAFVALATFGLSLIPFFLVKRMGVQLPLAFVGWIVVFIFATIFLGEAFDFYNRLWWWDIAMHGGSALGFGLFGFLCVFMMFEGDRYAAPAWAMAFFGFCFAVMIGAVWEIFEFTIDQTLGTNMQKSGLMDTMGDLIVDVVGGAFGAFCGFLWLKGREFGGLTRVIDEFIAKNRRLFRRMRR